MTTHITGHLSKMRVTAATPVEYTLCLGDDPSIPIQLQDAGFWHLEVDSSAWGFQRGERSLPLDKIDYTARPSNRPNTSFKPSTFKDERYIAVNTLLGKRITLTHTGQIYCTQCGRKTNKSFQQGYCFPCYRRLLECNLCTIHPEKCAYYQGKCDPNDWAHAHCGQTHVVYLANSSGLKVGITRTSQIPTRWIDQGATQGLPIFSVQNRYQAGIVEVALKPYIADKTNWRAMLAADNIPQDLFAKRDEILMQVREKINAFEEAFKGDIQPLPDATLTEITYPILKYPNKINAFNLDKDRIVTGELQGIKGQYLLLDTGVLNIRKFTGYNVELSFPNFL